jgi:hypothetical protein
LKKFAQLCIREMIAVIALVKLSETRSTETTNEGSPESSRKKRGRHSCHIYGSDKKRERAIIREFSNHIINQFIAEDIWGW